MRFLFAAGLLLLAMPNLVAPAWADGDPCKVASGFINGQPPSEQGCVVQKLIVEIANLEGRLAAAEAHAALLQAQLDDGKKATK